MPGSADSYIQDGQLERHFPTLRCVSLIETKEAESRNLGEVLRRILNETNGMDDGWSAHLDY